MRNCSDCTLCCTWLIGEAYGHTFGCGKSCAFKIPTGCSIYEKRPITCQKYQCAWLQGIIPYKYKPSTCGIIVSVEIWNNNQYLKAIETQQQVMPNDLLNDLITFCINNNCFLTFQKESVWYYYGSKDFIEFCNSKLEQVNT